MYETNQVGYQRVCNFALTDTGYTKIFIENWQLYIFILMWTFIDQGLVCISTVLLSVWWDVSLGLKIAPFLVSLVEGLRTGGVYLKFCQWDKYLSVSGVYVSVSGVYLSVSGIQLTFHWQRGEILVHDRAEVYRRTKTVQN